MIEEINTKDDITHAMSPLRTEMNEKLYGELTGVMNDIHETDFPERFWKLLLRDHTRAMISRIHLLDEKEVNIKPDLYPVNSRNLPGRKEKFIKGLILFVKHLKTRGNRKKVENLLQTEDSFRIGFPEYPGMDREKIGTELPLYIPLITGVGDKEKRDKVSHIADNNKDIFMKNVISHLPKILVEHFQPVLDSINVIEPEKKSFHVHNTHSLFNQMLIAKYIEQGARLIWYQHGSCYGEFRGDSSHHFEHSVADEYRSWGWKIREKDVPWKAYRLEKFRLEYDKYPDRREYDLLLAFPKIKNKTRKLYKDFTDYLLEHLKADKYEKILARPRALNKIQSHKSEIAFINDGRVVKSTGLSHMAEDMSKCRIVLQISVPATNFLECIYMDHITIGILQNDQPTDIVKPYYDFFLEKGVLHKNVESLVAHLNRVEPEDWWESVMADPMYQSYKETFTRKVNRP